MCKYTILSKYKLLEYQLFKYKIRIRYNIYVKIIYMYNTEIIFI